MRLWRVSFPTRWFRPCSWRSTGSFLRPRGWWRGSCRTAPRWSRRERRHPWATGTRAAGNLKGKTTAEVLKPLFRDCILPSGWLAGPKNGADDDDAKCAKCAKRRSRSEMNAVARVDAIFTGRRITWEPQGEKLQIRAGGVAFEPLAYLGCLWGCQLRKHKDFEPHPLLMKLYLRFDNGHGLNYTSDMTLSDHAELFNGELRKHRKKNLVSLWLHFVPFSWANFHQQPCS